MHVANVWYGHIVFHSATTTMTESPRGVGVIQYICNRVSMPSNHRSTIFAATWIEEVPDRHLLPMA